MFSFTSCHYLVVIMQTSSSTVNDKRGLMQWSHVASYKEGEREVRWDKQRWTERLCHHWQVGNLGDRLPPTHPSTLRHTHKSRLTEYNAFSSRLLVLTLDIFLLLMFTFHYVNCPRVFTGRKQWENTERNQHRCVECDRFFFFPFVPTYMTDAQ